MKTTLFILLVLLVAACDKPTIGYPNTGDAAYLPDTLVIPRHADLDPVADATRLDNNSPWVSLRIQGVLGTPPLYYSVASARETGGGSVDVFLREVAMIGGGIFYFPLHHETPPGRYLVSVRVRNEGHNKIIPDAFTFIVK